MLNEERVVLMTELAIFEEKANHKLQPATRYTKRDYTRVGEKLTKEI